jgi:hypothetical protein
LLKLLAANGPDFARADPWITCWEGWFLGQTAMPSGWLIAAAGGEAEKKRRVRLDAPKVAFGNSATLP